MTLEPEEKNSVLLVECRDEKGLVHRITGALLDQGVNIVSNREFVDAADSHFFMRTEFSGEVAKDQLIREMRGLLGPDAGIELRPPRRKELVILVTKEPHCLGDLLIRHSFGDLGARIRAVVGNHPTLQELTGRFEIPFHHVPHSGSTRESHEAEVLAAVRRYQPDYLVLAKYMRILTPGFVSHFPSRILNIHHSFLPAFAGAAPYRQAAERGVKVIGATAHFVTENLDEGPIIAQDTLSVDHTYDARRMAQVGRDVEKVVLARALRLVLEDRVMVHRNRTVVF